MPADIRRRVNGEQEIFLPFLPLTPIQVLLNNLIYDLSEIGIPFDNVGRSEIARPRVWDMGEILPSRQSWALYRRYST
jgi:hypothetical protein